MWTTAVMGPTGLCCARVLGRVHHCDAQGNCGQLVTLLVAQAISGARLLPMRANRLPPYLDHENSNKMDFFCQTMYPLSMTPAIPIYKNYNDFCMANHIMS